MKNGKISESVLKRSVLKQLHTVNEDVILKPGVGEDCAIVKTSGSTMAALSAQSVTLDIKDTHALARFSVYSAINNLASSGARPTGIMVTFLLPTLSNEAQLRETMRDNSLQISKRIGQSSQQYQQIYQQVLNNSFHVKTN